MQAIATKLEQINEVAQMLPTERCQIDPDLLFGIGRTEQIIKPPHHVHQLEFTSFAHTTSATLERDCFEEFTDSLGADVTRAKGFVRFPENTYLFNFVAGRWDLEEFTQEQTELVFIGKNISDRQAEIVNSLKSCEQ